MKIRTKDDRRHRIQLRQRKRILGTSILTTSRGVMTGKAAAKAGVGGEVLCNIW